MAKDKRKEQAEAVQHALEARWLEAKLHGKDGAWWLELPFVARDARFRMAWQLNTSNDPWWVMEILDSEGRSCGGTAPRTDGGGFVIAERNKQDPSLPYFEDNAAEVAAMIADMEPANWLGLGGRQGSQVAAVNAFAALMGTKLKVDLHSPGGLMAAAQEIDDLLVAKEASGPEI